MVVTPLVGAVRALRAKLSVLVEEGGAGQQDSDEQSQGKPQRGTLDEGEDRPQDHEFCDDQRSTDNPIHRAFPLAGGMKRYSTMPCFPGSCQYSEPQFLWPAQ